MTSTKTISDLNKIRAAFMQRASAPNIPHAAFKLGWLIAYRYMNRESGTAFVAQETLARDLNVTSRTVQTSARHPAAARTCHRARPRTEPAAPIGLIRKGGTGVAYETRHA